MADQKAAPAHHVLRFPSFKVVIESGEESPLVMTEDLNIAAYLKIIGYELFTVRKAKRMGLHEFYFKVLDPDMPTDAAKDILDFINNRGRSGRYLDYTNAWKDLKSMLNHF